MAKLWIIQRNCTNFFKNDGNKKIIEGKIMDDPIIYQMQSELCQCMSQPARLQLLHLLFEGPKNVGEISKLTGLGQATVSRNLGILRGKGIVLTERRGQEIFYRVANPKMVEVCNLMREVLSEQITERSKMFLQTDDK
jgi:ArsR family transcriptional regulator, virulence genes transcriptional regulator